MIRTGTGARWASALAVTLALAGCPRADRVEDATDRVYADELVDDQELPPPPGQEVAPRRPGEVEGGVEGPDPADRDTADEPDER